MNDQVKDGGPAFPGVERTDYSSCSVDTFHGGMPLRDYFAAKAMQGIISNPCNTTLPITNIVGISYSIADAMLAAREAQS